MAWDVTVPDTFTASCEHFTSRNIGAAVEKAAHKKCRYAAVSQAHLFIPIAVETTGSWHAEPLDFVQEPGGKIKVATA